jgi:hypothetical protein
MTPPGEDLEVQSRPIYLSILRRLEREGLVGLQEAVDRAIRQAGPWETKRLWRKRTRSGVLVTGCKLTLLFMDTAGKERVVEVLYIATTAKRVLALLREGPFAQMSLDEFCRDHGGQPI